MRTRKKRWELAATAFLMLFLCACGAQGEAPPSGGKTSGQLVSEGNMELSYADQFSVELYEGGYALAEIGDDGKYLVVPEGKEEPEGLEEDVVILKQPLDHIYLAATSAMDLFRAMGGIGSITLSGTDADGWYIEEAREAMENGDICYAGKYNAPDYELILADGCDLAVESTMIYHSPEVKEQLEKLGIPVLVERSSYEGHPLGRMEWIKLYGVLLGKEEEAGRYFEEQAEDLEAIMNQGQTGKTAAFFSVNSNGSVTVRKSGDYISKMIELAGGTYVFDGLGNDNELSTMNMQMEAFYAGAKDADVLIYNSAIEGEVHSLDGLFGKSELFRDFKAVKTGNVWCAESDFFQESTGIGDLLRDLHVIFTDPDAEDEDLHYLRRITE